MVKGDNRMTKEILAKIENIGNDQVMTLRTNKKIYKIPMVTMVELITDTVNKFGPIKEESIITFSMSDKAYSHIINLIEECERRQVYSKVIPNSGRNIGG